MDTLICFFSPGFLANPPLGRRTQFAPTKSFCTKPNDTKPKLHPTISFVSNQIFLCKNFFRTCFVVPYLCRGELRSPALCFSIYNKHRLPYNTPIQKYIGYTAPLPSMPTTMMVVMVVIMTRPFAFAKRRVRWLPHH